MTERRDDEAEPEGDAAWQRHRPPPAEGVRILGAEEAQAVMEGGAVSRRLDDDAPRFGDVPPRPDPSIHPAVRFPLPADQDPLVEEAAPQLDIELELEPPAAADPQTRPLELPHWTEPPTGEVPRIVIGDELDDGDDVDDELDDDIEIFEASFVDEDEDDASAWASLTGSTPRFRADSAAWQEDDAVEAVVPEASPEPEDVAPVEEDDDDAAFAAAVAARRQARPISSGVRRPTPADPARVGAPEGPRPTGGAQPDLTVRIVTAIAVGVVALICFSAGPAWTAGLITVIVAIGAFEMFDGLQRSGFRPATIIGVLGSASMVPIAYNKGLAAFPLVTMLVLIFSMLWYLFEVVRARPVVNVAVTMFGFAYLGVLGGFAGLILAGGNAIGLILGLAACAIGYDAFGYFIGSQFGHTRMSPKISPNKTVEGLVGGMAASIVIGLCLGAFGFTPFKGSIGHGFALGVIVAIVAPLGDLCESMLKRDLGVKDFGTLLPGHGGVLDRFDAMLFCLPAVYYLALWLNLFTAV